jgi:hypothetical protein
VLDQQFGISDAVINVMVVLSVHRLGAGELLGNVLQGNIVVANSVMETVKSAAISMQKLSKCPTWSS